MKFPSDKIQKEVEIKPDLKRQPAEIPIEIQPEAEGILETEEMADEKKGEIFKTRPQIFITKKKQEEKIQLTKSETLKKIEQILIENLDSYYQSLPEALRDQFKRKGEETATKIEKIIESAKMVVSKIFNLIASWLKIIPGINKFFIEQEAKIKTDRILAIAEKKKRQKAS